MQTGEPLDIASLLNYREADAEPPFPAILKSKTEVTALQLTGANRLAHPYLPRLRKLLEGADAVVLQSHGISADALLALQSDDLSGFLRQRAEFLQSHFAQVFARHARWGDSDRPSISALIVAEDGELS